MPCERRCSHAVGRRTGELFAGDQRLADASPLGEPPLLDGAVLTVDRAGLREPRGLLELHVLAGPDSGDVHHLAPGEHGIGRAVEARVRVDDPDVSRLHAVLRVATDESGGTTVHDLGSTNGTTVDGVPVTRDGRSLLPGQVLRVGDTRLSLVRPEQVPVSCRPDGAGHLEVNRPPRHLSRPAPVRVTVPPEPPARDRSRFPLVAVLLPLVAGVVLVAVTRSPTYLVFVLLSPLMALGTFWSDRVGGRRSVRAQRLAHAEQQARVTAAVARATADETTARRRAHPGPAALLLTATGPRPRLWERRRADDDALELRLGLGTVSSAVEVRTSDGLGGPEAVERPVLVDVPVTVPLAEAGVLGLAGPRSRVLPLARSLVAQLAGWHSPRHLDLVLLLAEPTRDWEWARWLPHLRTGPDGGPLRVGVDGAPAAGPRRRARRGAGCPGRAPVGGRLQDRTWTGPTTVVVLDGASALRRHPGVARLLDEGPDVGLRVLCLDRDLVSLPVECRATAEVTGPVGTRLRVVLPDATTYDDVVADGVGDGWGQRFARALAPLRDATPDDQQSALPAAARLLDLLPFDATDAGRAGDRVAGQPARHPGRARRRRGRRAARRRPRLRRPARPGRRDHRRGQVRAAADPGRRARPGEPAGRDVVRPGRLQGRRRVPRLRAAAAHRRHRHRPGRAPHRTRAALAGRRAAPPRDGAPVGRLQGPGRLPRRRHPPGHRRCPRLVLVVDEFATLVEELPDFVGGLVGIAQRGRSLGVHLVLATQRPGGVVSADIRANTSLRIALRVTDPAESTDVVDVRDAADIPRAHPGRAVVRAGAGPVRAAAVGAGRRPPGRGRQRCRCGRRRGSGPATRRRRPATRPPPARPTWPGWSTRPGRRPPGSAPRRWPAPGCRRCPGS